MSEKNDDEKGVSLNPSEAAFPMIVVFTPAFDFGHRKKLTQSAGSYIPNYIVGWEVKRNNSAES